MARAGELPPLDVAAMAKEAGLTAVVMFGLTVGMIGFRTIGVSGGLGLEFRFDSVLVATGLAFVVRCALVLMREGRALPVAVATGLAGAGLIVAMLAGVHTVPFGDVVVNWILALFLLGLAGRAGTLAFGRSPSGGERDEGAGLGARVSRASRFIAPALLAVAVVAPMLTYVGDNPIVDRRLVDIGVLVLTYVMLGWGLNIVVGLAGLLDLGYVAFYAVGAYSYALLALYYDASFWVSLPFAGVMAATFGILLGFPVLRLRGDYLAIVTLGFGEIIRVTLLNWYEFTKGPDGISGIPKPSFFGLELTAVAPEGVETFHSFFGLEYAPVDRVVFLYYVILVLALLTNWFTLRIRKLPIGRAWEALREDEIACVSLGINPTNTKLTAFAIGAMFGGFAGSFFATRQGFISPESFNFIESAVILAIVVLGGMGSQIGVVFAAVLLIGLPEFFRELQDYRMVAFGGAMVLIMLWRPAGLLAFREPTIRLFAKRPQPAAGEAGR